MGRRKQSRPNRSGGAKPKDDLSSAELGVSEVRGEGADESVKPLIVEVDRELSWGSDEGHRDLSEVVLTGLELSERLSCSEEFIRESNWKLRISVENVGEFQNRSKLWHWPVLSSGSVRLEFVVDSANEDGVVESVMLSGSFDGPDEAVTGLVHLVSLKLVTLRPVLGAEITEGVSSVRVRVEILKSTFDACESLLDCRRQVWKNSMMNVMAWLRPEATTLEARYGVNEPVQLKNDLVRNEETPSKIHARFDASGFYEAIKPSKKERMLEEELPDLLPELRPYQRRAAYWMVQQETGKQSIEGEDINFLTPLVMFYNPFSGSVSLNPEYSSSQHVLGGILADEMGLGKTVELLACIFCNRNPAREVFSAMTESPRYKGLWVQCDICDAWQHGDCVNCKTRIKRQKSGDCRVSRNSSTGADKSPTANIGDALCKVPKSVLSPRALLWCPLSLDLSTTTTLNQKCTFDVESWSWSCPNKGSEDSADSDDSERSAGMHPNYWQNHDIRPDPSDQPVSNRCRGGNGSSRRVGGRRLGRLKRFDSAKLFSVVDVVVVWFSCSQLGFRH
ncbi:unnamed protein product [Rhodiola kirilowii]